MLKNTTRVQVLETFAVLAAISLLAAIFYHRQGFILVALALLLVVLFIKHLAEGITNWWLKFSALVSGINNRVILALLFYLILTPIALIYRLFNKDALNLDRSESQTYYFDRYHTYSKNDLEKMW
ncbi:MAG: hypothetical protein HXX17_10535 [Geobacteraceae bacterium]|nr:hypothetical protein [Geobacteraceae bacterium]